MGQTGHVHGMVAIQKWRCPANFLYAYYVFFLFPNYGGVGKRVVLADVALHQILLPLHPKLLPN